MSECSNVATASKGATQYTHLFLCISSGRRLTNFSMRSLYFQINLHSSLNPLISHSVWCHRPDLHFNAAFSIALNKLLPLTINDLSISFDLYSRQLQSSSLLGVAKLELNQKETLQKARMPITYFYHQDPVDLIDTYTSTPVGNIFITVALGYSEQTNLVEPQTRFIMAQIVPVDKKNSKSESPSIWKKSAQKHGWLSIDEIKDNWRNIALKNGWKIPRNDFSFISFEPILIMPEYISPPTADLLNSPIEPSISVAHSSSVTSAPALFEENENNFSYDFVQPLEIASIFPQTPKPFHNAMKKPIIIMDFFPRFSYSNKYENSERTESEWDRLIGRYVKSNSSTTLKTFPKRKRPQSVGNSKRKEFFNFKNETTHNFQNKKKRDDENPRKVPFPPKIKSRNVKMHTYASSDLTTLIEDKYRIDFDESDNKDKNNEEMSINKNTNINNYQFSTKNNPNLPKTDDHISQSNNILLNSNRTISKNEGKCVCLIDSNMKISSESQDSFDMKNSSNSVSILGSNRKLLNKDDESSDSAINLKILDLSDENSLILPNIFSDGDNEIEIKSKEEKKPKIFDLSFEEIVEKEMEKLAHESGSSHSSLSPCSSNLNQNASGNTNLILNTHNTENNSSAIGGIQKVNIPSLPISSMHDSLNETDSQQTEIGKLPNKHSPPLVKNESQNNHLRKTPEYLNSSLNKRNNANGDSNNNSVDHNNIFWEKTVKSFSTTQSPQNRDKKNQNSYQLHSVAANKHSNDKKVIPYVPNGDNFNDKNNKPSLSYENKSSPHAKVAPKLDLKLVKVSSPRNEKLSSPRSPDGRRNSNFPISPPPGNHIEYQTPSSQDTKKTHHESRKLSPRKSHTPKRPTNLVEQLISLRSPPSSPETGNPFQKSPPGSPRSSSPKSSPRASPKSSPPNNSLVNVKQKIKAHGNNTDPVRSKERSSVNKVQKYRQNTHSQLSKQVRNASPSVLLHNVGKIPTSQANSNYGDHQQFNTYSPSYSTTSQKQSPISSRTNSLSTTRSSARNNQMQNQTLNQNSTYEQNQRYSPQNELIKNNNFQNDQSHSNFSQIQPLKLPNKETSTDSPLRRRSRLPRRSNSPRSIPDNSPSDHSSNNPSNLNSNVSATKKINSPPVSAFATVGSLQPRTINFKNRNKPDFINTINMSPTRSFSPGNVNNYKTNLTPDYNNYPLMNNSKTLNFNNSPNKTTLNNNANRSDEKVNLIHSTSPSSSSTGQYITNMSPASSPILRKRQPKLPFRDTTPYSPLSPTGSSKQGIKMSPSLERMINGIDQLELPIDISAFESDSDYSTNG